MWYLVLKNFDQYKKKTFEHWLKVTAAEQTCWIFRSWNWKHVSISRVCLPYLTGVPSHWRRCRLWTSTPRDPSSCSEAVAVSLRGHTSPLSCPCTSSTAFLCFCCRKCCLAPPSSQGSLLSSHFRKMSSVVSPSLPTVLSYFCQSLKCSHYSSSLSNWLFVISSSTTSPSPPVSVPSPCFVLRFSENYYPNLPFSHRIINKYTYFNPLN